MDVCRATLSYSFSVSPWLLFARYALGLLGILGWGFAFELAARARLKGFRFTHAFLEGTVVVSVLMLAASLICLPRPAMAIAAFGVLAGAFSLWRLRPGLPRPRRGTIVVLLFSLIPLASLIAQPMGISDLTSIWANHAKALACECLFHARYVTEKVWTGTHPEYPLYLPLLHAYFFSIADSFRDDITKLWQAVAVLAWLVLTYRRVSSLTGKRLCGATAAAVMLALVMGQAGDAKVELHAAIFTGVIFLCALEGDRGRLPLYLLGLATTKNEGLAGALVFLAMHAALLLATGKKRKLAYLGPAAVLLGAWLLVLLRLPSNHEQYPSHLVSFHSWRAGLPHLGEILAGCADRMARWPWILLFGIFPFVLTGALVSRRRDPMTLFCLLWTLAMLAVFLAIYIVTPWGPKLYIITVDRLLVQIFPALALGVILLWGRSHYERAATAGLLLLVAYYLPPVLGQVPRVVSDTARTAKSLFKPDGGIADYRWGAEWSGALTLDRVLPPASRGAVLNRKNLFTINFFLYPRFFYPTDPGPVSGSLKPWEPWTSLNQVNVDRYGFRFVLEREKVLYLR